MPNGKPRDIVQVEPIDDLPEQQHATRAVFVDVVKRTARVEPGPPSEAKAVAEPAVCLQECALGSKPDALWRVARQRRAQPFVFSAGICLVIRVARNLPTGERAPNEDPNIVENSAPVLLVEYVVVHLVENTHPLYVCAEPVKKFAFGREIHDPVRTAGEHKRRCSNRARVGD